jgi:hypothetical protein
MTKVEILESFTGFPDGTDASATVYEKGATTEVADEFADLIVSKGHARKCASAPAKPEKPFIREGDAA